MKVKHFLAQGCTVAMNVTDNTLQIGLSNKSNQEPNFSRKKGFLIATGRAVNKPINVNLNIENFQLTGKNSDFLFFSLKILFFRAKKHFMAFQMKKHSFLIFKRLKKLANVAN